MPSSRRRRGVVALVVIAWLAVIAGAVVWGLTRVEGDLEDRAAEALTAAGLGGVEVEVDGRDITVLQAPDGARDQVARLLGDLDGVRDVDFAGDRAAAPDEQTTTTPPVATTTAPVATTTAPVTTTTAPVTTTTAPPEGTTQEARTFIEATLDAGRFRLSGIVPDRPTATALLRAANVAYAPFVSSELEVVPEAEPEPWLAGAPMGISLLPMITEGTIRVEGDEIRLTGESPNPQYLALFEAAVAGSFGLDNVVTDVEITNLEPPRFSVDRSGGVVTLGGVLPNEQVQEILVGGARAVYGDEAVVDETAIGEDLYVSFWMYTMPGVYQLLAPFPEYELLVDQGVTSGALRQGASFEFDSAELTPQLQQLLSVAAAILSRDLSLGMAAEGHTDSIGPDDYNQRLSERRAQAAYDFLVAAGIAPERLRAVGFGESRPAVPNDTEENRAINRRVEFIFGPVAEVAGGQ